MRGLPDLETRAAVGMHRLSGAAPREHLAEVHGYARQSRTTWRRPGSRSRAWPTAGPPGCRIARSPRRHPLAVAAFRQQLVDWQGRVADMKRCWPTAGKSAGAAARRRCRRRPRRSATPPRPGCRVEPKSCRREARGRRAPREMEGHLADVESGIAGRSRLVRRLGAP